MAELVRQVPVFFIPGTACDIQLWSKLWPIIEDPQQRHHNYRLIHLEIDKKGSIEQVVDKLVEYVQIHSAGEGFHLIGFSLGGYLASAISLRFRESLKSLMVLSNTPIPLPHSELEQRREIISLINKHGYQGLKRGRIVNFIDTQQHDNNELIGLIQMMDKRFTKDDILHHLDALSVREDLCELLLLSGHPIHFCFGDADHLVDRGRLLKMQSQSKSIEISQVSGCGHFLPLEQPHELALNIMKWLEKNLNA